MPLPYWSCSGWRLYPRDGMIQVRDPDNRIVERFTSAVEAEEWARSHCEHTRAGGHARGWCGSKMKNESRVR